MSERVTLFYVDGDDIVQWIGATKHDRTYKLDERLQEAGYRSIVAHEDFGHLTPGEAIDAEGHQLSKKLANALSAIEREKDNAEELRIRCKEFDESRAKRIVEAHKRFSAAQKNA